MRYKVVTTAPCQYYTPKDLRIIGGGSCGAGFIAGNVRQSQICSPTSIPVGGVLPALAPTRAYRVAPASIRDGSDMGEWSSMFNIKKTEYLFIQLRMSLSRSTASPVGEELFGKCSVYSIAQHSNPSTSSRSSKESSRLCWIVVHIPL